MGQEEVKSGRRGGREWEKTRPGVGQEGGAAAGREGRNTYKWGLQVSRESRYFAAGKCL